MTTMLENLLKQHDNFGGKEQIVKVLTLLEKVGSASIPDLRSNNIPDSTTYFLQYLEIIKKDKDKVSLVSKSIAGEIPLIIYQSLFEKIKTERLLHDFINERSLYYDRNQEYIFVKNNLIPLKFSALRNLLLNFDFFLKDKLIPFQFYIHPDLKEWFRDKVIPDIELSRINDNPLSNLIERRTHQEEAGKQAEMFALNYERRQRINHRNVGNIKIISELDTSAGYDIESYEDDNSLLLDKFIEVKSYTGIPSFFWSSNEVDTAKEKEDRYYLYLVDRDATDDKYYHPIQINDPASCLFSDGGWTHCEDGYFFEKKNY